MAVCGNLLGVGVRRIVLTGIGDNTLTGTCRIKCLYTIVPCVCIRIVVAVFLATGITNCLCRTGCGTADMGSYALSGHSATYGTLDSSGAIAIILSGNMRSEGTVFPAAGSTLSLGCTGSSAAGANVRVDLAADGTSAVYKVVVGASKNRNDNIINSYLNEAIAILNVKLVTSLAGIELNITNTGVGRSYRRMSLRLTGVVVIFLSYRKHGS